MISGNTHTHTHKPITITLRLRARVNKRTKWDVKVFVVCDAETGYILNFEIYTGHVDNPDDNKGATYHVVMRLMKDYLDQGYCVFMDNFYSSPTLFNNLLLRSTDAVGTCL